MPSPIATSRRAENLRFTLRSPSQPTYLSTDGDLVAPHIRPTSDRNGCDGCLPRALPPRGRSLQGLEDDVDAPGIDPPHVARADRRESRLHDPTLEVPVERSGVPGREAQALLDDCGRPRREQPPPRPRRGPPQDRVAQGATGAGFRDRGNALRRAPTR